MRGEEDGARLVPQLRLRGTPGGQMDTQAAVSAGEERQSLGVSRGGRAGRPEPRGCVVDCPREGVGGEGGAGKEKARRSRDGGSEAEVTRSCPTLYNPMDWTVQATGFSRPEYWSG